MKNIKIKSIIAVMLVAMLLFTSCGKKENSDSTTAVPEEIETTVQTEITTADDIASDVTDNTTENIAVSSSESAVSTTDNTGTSTTTDNTSTSATTATSTTKTQDTKTATTTTKTPATQTPTTEAPSINYTTEAKIPTADISVATKTLVEEYYITCTVYSEEDGRTSTECASDGKKLFFHANVEGTDAGFIIPSGITGSMYIINYTTKQYLSISSALMKVVGLDTDELLGDEVFDQINIYTFTDMGGVIPQKVNVGGTDCYKYGYIDGTNYKYFYFRAGENVPFRIDTTAMDGSKNVQVTFDTIEYTVGTHLDPPSDFKEIKFSLSQMEEAEAFMDAMEF